MFPYISFQEALDNSDSNRRLLLGNGFSIDWKPDIFKYDALMNQADFSTLSVDAQKLFSLVGSPSFESVIEALRKAAELTTFYSTTNSDLAQKFINDANELKEILAKTIAASHPEYPNEISQDEYMHARQFLSNFKSIYTLNYDLLLYWVLMHDEAGPSIKECDDGFRNAEEESADYVVWDSNFTDQNIHYMHGALHIFDAGTELKKYTWIKTGIKLIDQIRDALDQGLFPLVVSEGTSNEKLKRIAHSGYLARTRKSFANNGGSYFIHGHSLNDNDDHIIKLIPESKVNKVFVSLTSDPTQPENTHKVNKLVELVQMRKEILKKIDKKKDRIRKELEIYIYNPISAKVWRG